MIKILNKQKKVKLGLKKITAQSHEAKIIVASKVLSCYVTVVDIISSAVVTAFFHCRSILTSFKRVLLFQLQILKWRRLSNSVLFRSRLQITGNVSNRNLKTSYSENITRFLNVKLNDFILVFISDSEHKCLPRPQPSHRQWPYPWQTAPPLSQELLMTTVR